MPSGASGKRGATPSSPPAEAQTGTEPPTRVPRPGADQIVKLPLMAPSRSPMLTNPWPSTPTAARSKPAPSSATSKQSVPSSSQTWTLSGRAVAGVLGRVLHRLEAAEVDRRLDVLVVAADAVGLDRRGQR